MPVYEYECRKCGIFDYEQPMSARPLSRCPKCRAKVQKLISASAFHLKGGGWYADGYDRKAAGSSEPKADTKTDTPASDATPAATPPPPTSSPSEKKKGGKSKSRGKSAAA